MNKLLLKRIIEIILIAVIICNAFIPLSLATKIDETDKTEIETKNKENLDTEETEKEEEKTDKKDNKTEKDEDKIEKDEDKIECSEETDRSVKVETNAPVRALPTNSSEIQDGTYIIKSYANTQKALDVKDNNVQIWDKNEVRNQKFTIKNIGNGYYTIQNTDTGKMLDVYGGYTQAGTNVQIWEANNTDGQKWKIEKEGENYIITSKISGLSLDIYGANYKANGTNIAMWTSEKTNWQKWIFEKYTEPTQSIEEGTYLIKSYANLQKAIEVKENNVQIWDKSEAHNQKFTVKYVGSGYYTIQNTDTGKMLDVYGGYTQAGTNVQIWEANNTDGQKWKIEKEGENYIITSKISGLSLDIYGANYKANGTNIAMWTSEKTNWQKWVFEKYTEPKQIIENGTYEISMASNTNLLLDITGASKKDGANVEIWKKVEANNQKFDIQYVGQGFYKITAVKTGKALDVYGGYTKAGTNVQMWQQNGTDGQLWKIVEVGNNTYNILSKASYLCLDVYGGYTTAGTNVQIWENNGTEAQKFKFQKTEPHTIDDGLYEIQMAIDTSKVLDVEGASKENGANLEIWNRQNTNNQKFTIKFVKDDYYTIQDVRTEKMLDVYGGYTQAGTNVQLWEKNNEDWQIWKIVELKDGTYNIISKHSGLYLDIFGGNTTAGTNVQIWQANGMNSQKFKFAETSRVPENESNYGGVNEAKYPGFKEALQRLQAQHPNWTIKVKYTGIDWNTAVNSENSTDGSGTPESLTDYGGAWRHPTDTRSYGSGWYRASREAIAYMMDPRNSLDDGYIFQFQDLTSTSGSYNDIANMISGTFLTRYQNYSTQTIVNSILSGTKLYNVSPFHITSRILQEQGINGGALNGYSYNGRIVYNLFNINASGSTDEAIIRNGAQKAYDMQWFSPVTCILGSVSFLRSNYFNRGQTTLYYQKYNVVGSSLFTHQYMQNIRAANDEGKRVSDSYKKSGLINSDFTFEIPLYENMPASPSPRPAR